MNIWKILDIEKTNDKKVIKKAYHAKLKVTHPEDNQQEFIRLREAYEKALEWVENNSFDDELEFENDDIEFAYENDYEQEYEYVKSEQKKISYEEISLKERKRRKISLEVAVWWGRVRNVWVDLNKRYEQNQWKKLLYEDIPFQVVYYEKCREKIEEFLIKGKEYFLPEEVWRVIDGFFEFSLSDAEVTASNDRKKNKRIKLNEFIDFKSLHMLEDMSDIDGYFSEYKKLCERIISDLNHQEESDLQSVYKKLQRKHIQYLPAICLYEATCFDKYTDEEFNDFLCGLQEEFGENININLLEAEYLASKGKYEQAQEILKGIYKNVPTKDFMLILRMAICCENAFMFYEAYMLIKELTWLNPQPFMQEFADRLCEKIENSCNEKRVLTDLDRISLCRMYLRSNREEEASLMLGNVKNIKENIWEYNMAKCLCIFNEDDISLAAEGFAILEAYPKENISEIDKLEWEELKARYLFEQKKYSKCVEKCCELLDEYPMSYPILLLRAYADWCKYRKKKKYSDLPNLIKMFPNRVEALTLLATIQYADYDYKDVCDVLEPVKDKCYMQYRFGKVMCLTNQDFDLCIDQWMDIFGELKEKEFYIPAVSKYGLIDLRTLYVEASDIVYAIRPLDRESRYIRLLVGMKDSQYNNPQKYVKTGGLFYSAGYKELALESYLEELKNATGEEESDIRIMLVDLYGEKDMIKEMEEQISLVDESKLSPYTRSVFYEKIAGGYKKCSNPDYEKAEKYYIKKKDIYPTLQNYNTLSCFYEEWFEETGDEQKLEKGVEIAKEGLANCGITGDFLSFNGSIYLTLTSMYIRLGKNDEALQAMEDLKKYTKNNSIKKQYHERLARVYKEMGNMEKAYEYYLVAQQEGYNPELMRLIILGMQLTLEKYEEAYEGFYQWANEYEKPEPARLMCAVHAKYNADGKFDMELVRNATDIIEEQAMNPNGEEGDDLGGEYSILVDLYNILGDKDKVKFYKEKMDEFVWNDPSGKIVDMILPDLWDCWYKKEYKKALKIIEDNPKCHDIGHVEIESMYYHLKKKYVV